MSNRKIKIYSISILITIILLVSFRSVVTAIFSIGFSYICTIDKDYILKREWSGEEHGTIRFSDGSEILKGDTVYRNNKPLCIIKRLNKHFNEMVVYTLDNKYYDTYLSTEELTK